MPSVLSFVKVISHIIFLILLSITCISAQDIVSDSTAVDSTNIVYKKSEGPFKKLFRGKPGKAALWGLAIPGGGQFYNRKYLTGIIAAGIDATFLSILIYNQRQFNNLDDIYFCRLESCPTDLVGIDTDVIIAARDVARQNKEQSILYFAGAHLFTVLWAYVQAHLMEFDDSDDLSLKWEMPEYKQFAPSLSNYPQLTLSISLNSGAKKINTDNLIQP